MSVGEICNREVVICRPDDSIQEAAKLMRDQHVGNVVVAQESGNGIIPIGILTDRDIVIELLAEEVDIDSVSVADVMSTELITVKEDHELMATIELMRDKGIRRIPVVDNQGELVGIVAIDDLIELIADQLTDLVKLIGRELSHEQRVRSALDKGEL